MKQDPAEATLRAHPEEGRRRDRLELAGAEDLQSIARVSALAGRVQLLSRPDVSHLESARGRAMAGAGRAGPADSAEEAAAGGLRRGELRSKLIEVQVEGRKRMPAEAFLNGQHLKDNEMLGVKVA